MMIHHIQDIAAVKKIVYEIERLNNVTNKKKKEIEIL